MGQSTHCFMHKNLHAMQMSFDDFDVSKSRIVLRETDTTYFPEGSQDVMGCPEDVVAFVWDELFRELAQEAFVGLTMTTANYIQSMITTTTGGIASSIVEPRQIFQAALLDNAACFICLHNHPSGKPEPSRQDKRITRQINEGAKLLGIPMHDHIIVSGRHQWTSLANRGIVSQ